MVDSSKHIEKIFEQKRDFVIIATTGKVNSKVTDVCRLLMKEKLLPDHATQPADICAERYKRIETINIFVAILTFCGVLFLIIEPDKNYLWIKIATSILTVIMVAIAAYFKSSDLKILEKQHRETAGKFLAFKNHLEQIIADIHIRRRAILDIEIEYKRMMECLNELYATVPVAYDREMHYIC